MTNNGDNLDHYDSLAYSTAWDKLVADILASPDLPSPDTDIDDELPERWDGLS